MKKSPQKEVRVTTKTDMEFKILDATLRVFRQASAGDLAGARDTIKKIRKETEVWGEETGAPEWEMEQMLGTIWCATDAIDVFTRKQRKQIQQMFAPKSVGDAPQDQKQAPAPTDQNLNAPYSQVKDVLTFIRAQERKAADERRQQEEQTRKAGIELLDAFVLQAKLLLPAAVKELSEALLRTGEIPRERTLNINLDAQIESDLVKRVDIGILSTLNLRLLLPQDLEGLVVREVVASAFGAKKVYRQMDAGENRLLVCYAFVFPPAP
jgi:hypothetical protein